MKDRTRILICGILPPPYFGHSMMYKMLMASEFPQAFDVTFFNVHFWTYQQHKKVTLQKILKLIKYLVQYIYLILIHRPRYVLYNMSFDRMPFAKDVLFCGLGRLLGCRIVLHDMGQYARELFDGSGNSYRRLFGWLMKNTSASIVLGESTKQTYAGFLEANRLFAVPGCVEDSRKAEDEAGHGSRDPGHVKVLYFSFLSVSKGVWTGLKAAVEVVKKDTSVRFTFAGPFESDGLKSDIEQFINAHGLSEKIVCPGYVGDDQKRTELFRAHDIFMFPTHRDVFGLVLLHAFAEGLPVIASREGTIPEIVADGENGFLVPKGDVAGFAAKILQLANDAGLRRKMGEASRRRYLTNYTPARYGERMIETFHEIERTTQGGKP